MGRVGANAFEQYSDATESEWFKLENDKDVARVQFLHSSPTDLDIFACHKVATGDYYSNGNPIEKYVDCKRDYDDPIDMCPFCQAGLKVKPVMIVSMYDHNDKKVKIWERGKTFKQKMDALFNRYGDLRNLVVEIERNGKKGDKQTRYELFQMPEVEPLDVSDIERQEFIGSLILDWTPDTMQQYLDTGVFPQKEDNSNSRTRTQSQPARRGSGQTMRSEQVTPRASRGGAPAPRSRGERY